MIRLVFCALILSFLVMACSGNAGQEITEAEYGDSWPLNVPRATLHCDSYMVWVETNGYAYPINGTAMSGLGRTQPSLQIRNLEHIWRYDDKYNLEWQSATGENPGIRISISGLIDDGLALCEAQ